METIAKSSVNDFVLSIDEEQIFKSGTHCEGLLQRLRNREDLCDLVLIAGDKRIAAHRAVLIASCDYFSALLSGHMRESQEQEIILSEMDGEAFEKIVNYCYTGSLALQGDCIEALITTANYLQLTEITEGCCKLLQRYIKLSNCFDIFFFANHLYLESLLQSTKNFICENFEEVSECPKLLLLNAKQLHEIISSNILDISSEERVFKVLIKWIEYEPEDRRKHFTELLAQVRLHLLPPTFLFEMVEPLCNTTESLRLFINALKPKEFRSSDYEVLGRCLSKRVDLLAIYNDSGILKVVGYNLHTEKWRILTSVNYEQDFAATLIKENLIIVSGVNDDFSQNRVTMLNLPTMTATEMPWLTTRRYQHSIAALNGFVYVVGGLDQNRSLTSVEKLDPVGRTWSLVAPMQSARESAGVAVLNDRLYVSGGYSNGTIMMSVECYNPVENVWEYKASMQLPRVSHSLIAHKNYLYAIGGLLRYGNLERYDPSIDTWTYISSSPIYNSARCALLGSNIFIYNKANFYKMSSESLQLQRLSSPSVNSRALCIALFGYIRYDKRKLNIN